MKKLTLLKYIATGLILFQIETVLGANFGKDISGKSVTASTKATVYQKVFNELSAKNPKITKQQLKNLGPGVTGGGDSCEQKIAYSYSFFLELIENDKISAGVFNMEKVSLLNLLKETKFGFDRGLKANRPVEALNAPQMNAILLDRAICNNNFEPLSYYAPLMMHEALRLAGLQEADANYEISKTYVATIRREAEIAINNKRNFRILSGTASGGVALAWGMGGQLLDFEAMDKMTEYEQLEFFDKASAPLENYLVDLKRMKIMAIIGSSFDCGDRETAPDGNCAWAELNETLNYNDESFGFVFEPYTGIGFRILNSRSHNWIESFYAVNNRQELIGSCTKDCNKIVENAVEAKITPAQDKKLRGLDVSYSYSAVNSGDGYSWQVTVEGTDYHAEEDRFCYLRAPLKIEFVKGKFKVTAGKFKELSREEYLKSLPIVSY